MTSASSLSSSHKSKSTLYWFEALLSVTHTVGFVMIVLNAYFFNTYLDGLAWPNTTYKNSAKGTQLHGFFMVLAFVFLQGEALLTYRIYRYNAKILSKLFHTTLHVLAIGLGATALAVIILKKNLQAANHFSTVHSWIGIALLTIYTVQFLFGLFTFLFPCAPVSVRAKMMPLHRIIGGSCLVLGACQSIIGYVQFISWTSPSCFGNLSCHNGIEFVAIFSVITIVVYTALVIFTIIPSSWRREKTPDEMK